MRFLHSVGQCNQWAEKFPRLKLAVQYVTRQFCCLGHHFSLRCASHTVLKHGQIMVRDAGMPLLLHVVKHTEYITSQHLDDHGIDLPKQQSILSQFPCLHSFL